MRYGNVVDQQHSVQPARVVAATQNFHQFRNVGHTVTETVWPRGPASGRISAWN